MKIDMAKTALWITIVASLCVACAVQAATATKPHARRVYEHSGHERSGHAAYRTVRYARPGKASTTTQSHVSHSSHASPASKTKAKAHHATHHRYSRRRRSHHHVVLPKAPSADRVTQIQAALARGGYYTGDPTGRWDSNTSAAVQKFQSANNIDATGKLDAPTLQKLGLGSDIAGVAAPRPVVPKMCCTAGPTVPTGATAVPAKPAGLTSAAPAVDHAQSVTVAPAAAQSSAAATSGAPSVGVTPATGSSAGSTSDPASAAKPAADQH
ncbi:MAG: peptidoglycan-binding domain-containing protein [Terracidiphilus sp.]